VADSWMAGGSFGYVGWRSVVVVMVLCGCGRTPLDDSPVGIFSNTAGSVADELGGDSGVTHGGPRRCGGIGAASASTA
jgi:hypothetical protein